MAILDETHKRGCAWLATQQIPRVIKQAGYLDVLAFRTCGAILVESDDPQDRPRQSEAKGNPAPHAN